MQSLAKHLLKYDERDSVNVDAVVAAADTGNPHVLNKIIFTQIWTAKPQIINYNSNSPAFLFFSKQVFSDVIIIHSITIYLYVLR
jgi:hypothetical protein